MASNEDSTFDMVVFPPVRPPSLALGLDYIEDGSRRPPLSEQEFLKSLDCDGRLVAEHKLRQIIFKGGVQSSIRKQVWQFLFGLYPFNSTRREREVLLAEKYCKYKALKNRWKLLLSQDDEGKAHLQPAYYEDELLKDGAPEVAPNASVDLCNDLPMPDLPSPEIKQQIAFMSLESQWYAERRPFDMEACKSAIKIIDKDVPRTDRELDYFKGPLNPHLDMLRDALTTFCAFHPEINYTQGMNDILSRFIVTFDSEVESYWCFEKYICELKNDFVEDGILNRINIVRELLSEIDNDLLSYIEHLGIGDLTFCHRWMLLLFKREFPWEESLRCFEMLSSRHLELSSMEAEMIRDKERRQDFESIDGKNRMEEAQIHSDYTFDVFLCVTILIEQRENIFLCQDMADLVHLICSLSMKMNLDALFAKSEALFEQYCRKSALDCFHILDYPSPIGGISPK